jgi:hypothetical protein
MSEVLDQIIRSYSLMASQTDAELQAARMRVMGFLRGREGTPRELTIDGIRFLRGDKPARKRRRRFIADTEALDWGLANEVVPDAALMGRAREVAREIAANAPLAVQAAKRMMRMGLNETFPDHVHHVYLQLLPLFKTQDMQEGIKAFMEKREPKFEGR